LADEDKIKELQNVLADKIKSINEQGNRINQLARKSDLDEKTIQALKD
jgi:hypothetical protein